MLRLADDALFIATHTGLYRVGAEETKAERVGEHSQDTMGFTITGSNRFLGSGHPDIDEAREQGLPPLLGLIESRDAGRTWRPISLSGEADFHLLRFAANRVYGYDASNDRLLASADRGRTWQALDMPADRRPGCGARRATPPCRHLVRRPSGRPLRVPRRRRQLDPSHRCDRAACMAHRRPPLPRHARWPGFVSQNGGRRLEPRGHIGGEPAALLGHGRDDLYAALHDWTIKRSTDGGTTWTIRSRP